jgi:histidine ammonia-lyase
VDVTETTQVELTSQGLTADQVIAIARHGARLEATPSAWTAVDGSAAVIDRILTNHEIVYGVTTGFGSLADTVIPSERSAELQVALLRSHAAGMGDPVEVEVVRAMMALRARTLAMGYSGVRREVVQTIVDVLNAGLTPEVPEHGSLGASGDLAPLAHAALCLVGEGRFRTEDGSSVPSREGLRAHGIEPLTLRAKEGLALINGTDGMLGMLVMAIADLTALSKVADIAAASSIEALMGTDRVFAEDLQRLRPQVGQAASAANLRALLADSAIVESHREHDTRVQDAYSLRCTPAVHGVLRDTLHHARVIADRELVSAIDNPMILPDGRVESCGNFHGAPLAQVADFLAVSVADLSALSERRTDRMLDRNRSHGLPPFLAGDAGIDSGMMIAHYTQAAQVAENRRLAAPASVDTIPTSALQEDHVSMGWAATRKLRAVVRNLRRVLAVELTTAIRGVELRDAEPGQGVAAARDAVRSAIPGIGPDRWLAPELAEMDRLLSDDSVLSSVEAAVGPLG